MPLSPYDLNNGFPNTAADLPFTTLKPQTALFNPTITKSNTFARENIAANLTKVNSLHVITSRRPGHVSIDLTMSPCAAADLRILLWHIGEKARIIPPSGGGL